MAWVRIDDEFPDHPKAEKAGDEACWLYVCGLAYCNRMRTDGLIPTGRVGKLTGLRRPMKLADKLVGAGLWETADGGFRVHDYFDFQPSAEAQRLRSEERSEAGRKGAEARWGDGKPNGKSHSNSHSSAVANECPVPVPLKEGSNEPSMSGMEVREDVDRLCRLLANLIVANGRPKHLVDPTAVTWRREGRLLLDRDGRTVDEAERLIRWCQKDPFWKGNILSMAKFREQYDQLRHKAESSPRKPAVPRDDQERIARARQ